MLSTPQSLNSADSVGVYVHFPWCLSKCPYCDFVSFEATREAIDHRGYAEAVLAEFQLRKSQWHGRSLSTLFVGGGTPSLWEPEAMALLLDGLRPMLSEDAEISMECNPSSLDAGRAADFVAAGINRLSVGVQGLETERLKQLGRIHNPDQALQAIDAALATGAEVNADLIFGVATQRSKQQPDQAAADAGRVAATGVHHISAYQLTIEPNTGFGELDRKGRLPLVSEDTMASSFEAVSETLTSAGFEHYELSNFAQPGRHCRHNLGYWSGRDYLGLGCAAFGTISASNGAAVRYRNPPVPDKYLQQIKTGTLRPHQSEELSSETRFRERLMLGLRLADGIDLARIEEELGRNLMTPERSRRVAALCREGRLELKGQQLRILPEAWLFADGIAASLF